MLLFKPFEFTFSEITRIDGLDELLEAKYNAGKYDYDDTCCVLTAKVSRDHNKLYNNGIYDGNFIVTEMLRWYHNGNISREVILTESCMWLDIDEVEALSSSSDGLRDKIYVDILATLYVDLYRYTSQTVDFRKMLHTGVIFVDYSVKDEET